MKLLHHPDLGLLVLRTGAAAMLMTHGWSKVLRIAGGNFEFADPIGIGPAASLILAAAAEFLCSLAVLVGFKARLAAIPPLATMLVAGFIQHANDPFGRKELAFLYAVSFAAVVLLGPGRFSVDGAKGAK
jgi:putative oxidoreductase